ncbi:MAG: hypothetical protein M3Z04_21525 [Chloroflexota bacterium]|nr:hypothetical protein [Chloroflexota bacterium]
MVNDLMKEGKRAAKQAGKAARKEAIKALGVKEASRRGDLGWLLLGIGLGALVTYLMDPDRGRRRQAMLRDSVVQAGSRVQSEMPKLLQEVQTKIQAVPQGVSAALKGGKGEDAPPEEGADGPTSPEWEIAHNDDGALTGPTH